MSFLPAVLQNDLVISFFEKYTVFSPYVLRMILLVFRYPLQHNDASNSEIHFDWENSSTLRFWVSFLLIETRWFEKAKDYVVAWFLLIFKFCFLKNFGLHSLHQFQMYFLCKLIIFSHFWGFILSEESFRARNCRHLQLCFVFFRVRNWFLKLQAFFFEQVVNRFFFPHCCLKINLCVDSLHGKPSLLQFSPIKCNIVFSRNSSKVSKTCISVLSLKVSTNKVSLVSSCLYNNLSASARQ